MLAAFVPASARGQALYEAFIRAVETDNADRVREMLARGVDPNIVDPHGEPVLVVAARAGWERTVDALLGAGAKVDSANGFGDRPIMVAALNGHLSIVKTLHRRGAALDAPGWTPLIYAATNGQIEVVRYLLDAGAAIDAASPNGTTALMMAVRGGHLTTVELLLARGADVSRRNQDGATALTWARRGGSIDIETMLKRRGAQ
jgi:ankyrin repeat protein